MPLYNCRSIATGYRIVKFDDDLNVETIYELSSIRGRYRCPCFRGNSATCRHREMLAEFIKAKQINTALFYDYDNNSWKSFPC